MKKTMVLVGMLVISAVVFAQNAETDFTVTLTDDNAGVVITKYSGTAKNVVIPATIQGMPVREIGQAAFAYSSITSVTFPESITAIREAAFTGSALASITWPAQITVITNAYGFDGMFSGCRNLKTVIIPEGVTSIGDYAFAGCTSLTSVTLPSTITTIEGIAFYGCYSLTALTIPETVSKIKFGTSAFTACVKLPLAIQAKLRQLGYTDSFITDSK